MMLEPVEVLLVDDDADNAELALHALEKYQVSSCIHVVRDGVEALDFLFGEGAYAGRDVTQQPKVILLDLKLPRMDGYEVLKRLKADARTQCIPVVVMTTSSREGDVAKSYELGCNSFIVKPVDFDQFTAAVYTLGYYWILFNQPSIR